MKKAIIIYFYDGHFTYNETPLKALIVDEGRALKAAIAKYRRRDNIGLKKRPMPFLMHADRRSRVARA